MPIGKLTIELNIEGAHSLKERRRVILSLKDKVRHTFNASVAELDDSALWNRATLGVVAISSSSTYLTGQMEEIDRFLHNTAQRLGAEITDSYAELLAE